MNESKTAMHKQMKRILYEFKRDITQLSIAPCYCSKSLLLFKLMSNIEELNRLCNMQSEEMPEKRSTRQKEFTLEELSQYIGKNGKPAYVAVNGIVYDVTNIATWAAATHFGLSAGKDLTSAFASCHPGQPVLNKLEVVGKLI